jgi:hypothetical protein
MSGTDEHRQGADVPTVNRSALVLEPAEAYWEWANSCHGDDPKLAPPEPGDEEEGTVYLIPEMDFGPEAWLRRNYATMFEHELWAWCTDETFWPEDRSLKAFKRFFKVRFHSMVLDMGEEPIARDSE